MDKKKIVHVAQSATGGVSEYLYMFLNNSIEEFENILIVSVEYKEQIEKFKNIASKIYYVEMQRNIKIGKDVRAVLQIRKILKQQGNDYILYLHSSKAGAIGRIAVWCNSKVKVLYNAHGWYFNAKTGIKKKIYAIVEKILAYRANMIINISESEYNSALESKIAKPEKMCVIENGIDFTKYNNGDKYREEIRKRYGIREQDKVIGVVGRLALQKDPMTLIKAFKILEEKYADIKLMFIGAGELEEEILDAIKKNNLTNSVIITGWVNDVEKYIAALDIATLPSRWEGFGLAIVEYMASYKPIIASNVGGIANIIDSEKRGSLFPIGDEKKLAELISNCIENIGNKEESLQNNYNYAKERYDIKKVIQNTKNILRKMEKSNN